MAGALATRQAIPIASAILWVHLVIAIGNVVIGIMTIMMATMLGSAFIKQINGAMDLPSTNHAMSTVPHAVPVGIGKTALPAIQAIIAPICGLVGQPVAM